ncbi:ABC transporter permease [Candidatus Parcubacteria bacterium]|nr:ABC transporter permease [Candidatus Parcubacteria bacterium]
MKRVKPEPRSKIYWALSDFAVLTKRSMVYIVRNMDQALSTVFMPIMFLMLFRYVFGGAIETPGVSYVDFLFAGILVQTAAFGATYTAIGVTTDIRRGIVDRFKSLPMVSSAVLVGHTVTDLVRNTISAVIMVLVGLLVGFRPEANAFEWLLVLGILMVFTFAISWLSAIMGLLSKTVEGVQWMTFVFVFPVTFISSAFVPTASMPSALRAFAENQPVTHVIEAIRSLTVGTPMGSHGWLALAWSLAILIVSYLAAVYIFKRKTTAN